MKIGELAKKAQCTTETIRYYEKNGLLMEGDRGANNYRIYNKEHLGRLIFIRNCRALEMSHQEIKDLIMLMSQNREPSTHTKIHQVLNEHLHHIEGRMNELETLRRFLINLQGRCDNAHNECELMDDMTELGQELVTDIKKSPSHL